MPFCEWWGRETNVCSKQDPIWSGRLDLNPRPQRPEPLFSSYGQWSAWATMANSGSDLQIQRLALVRLMTQGSSSRGPTAARPPRRAVIR